MSKVFLSYSRRSEENARRISNDIEGLGHTVWIDEKLTGGQAWWEQILAKVRDCELFVLVLDEESLQSTACTREYGYAADLGKPILPILVSDEVSINLLPKTLLQIQFVDYRERDQTAAFRLAKALTDTPSPGQLPDPLPPPPAVPMSYIGDLSERVDRGTLSREEQSLLVVDLKEALGDPANAADARRLLGRLRNRPDVFARVEKEIDHALGAAGPSVLKRVGTAAAIAVAAVVAWQVLPMSTDPPEVTTQVPPMSTDSPEVTTSVPEEPRCSEPWVWSMDLQTCVRNVTIPAKTFSVRLDQPISEVRGRIDFYLNTQRLPDSGGRANYRDATGQVQAKIPIMLGDRMVGDVSEVIYSTSDGEICGINLLPEATGHMKAMRVSYWLELTDCQGLCRTSLSSPTMVQVYTNELQATVAPSC